MRALKRRKCLALVVAALVLLILVIRSFSMKSKEKTVKVAEIKGDKLIIERKRCYSHDVRHSKKYSDLVEFFPNLNSSFTTRPKLNEAIFFVDANCSASGLLDITPRWSRDARVKSVENNSSLSLLLLKAGVFVRIGRLSQSKH